MLKKLFLFSIVNNGTFKNFGVFFVNLLLVITVHISTLFKAHKIFIFLCNLSGFLRALIADVYARHRA